MKMIKSFLRHLLGAALTATGIILTTEADVSLKSSLATVAAACIPVVVKYLDPTDSDYGVSSNEQG